MPLPPSHSNFYDNEDDGDDYDGMRKKRKHFGVEAGGHTYAKDKAWKKSKEEGLDLSKYKVDSSCLDLLAEMVEFNKNKQEK